MMLWRRLGICVILSMMLVTGCGRHAPIKIGFAGTMVGGFSCASINGRNGIQLAVEEINHRGGIHGRPVELVMKDDRFDPEIALEIDREFKQDGVVAVIGHMTSNISKWVLPEINRMKLLVISPTASSSQLAGKDDYLIRLHPSSIKASELLAESLGKVMRHRSVAVAYDLRNQEYTEDWLETFEKTFTSYGGRIAAIFPFSSGLSFNYHQSAKQLLNSRADAVVIIAHSKDTAMFSQQIRKYDPMIPLYASDSAFTGELVQYGGPAVDKLMVPTLFYDEHTSSGYARFKTAYRRRFGTEPTLAAVLGYESAQLIFQGLAKTKRYNSESLRKTILETKQFQGLHGTYIIDGFGDAVRNYDLVMIRDNRLQKVSLP